MDTSSDAPHAQTLSSTSDAEPVTTAPAPETAPDNRAASIAGWLVLTYVFLSPFNALLILPYVNARVQPTEIVFLILLPFVLLGYGRRLLPSFRWQLIFGAYVAANICAAVV